MKDIKGKWEKFFKYFSLSRNALAVIGGTFIAYMFNRSGSIPFTLTGHVEPGFPPVRLPPFSTIVNNQTLSFGDMFSELGSSTIAIPLISILESVAVAKAFGIFNLV